MSAFREFVESRRVQADERRIALAGVYTVVVAVAVWPGLAVLVLLWLGAPP